MNGAPNLSVILPGPCQAHCEFCYWRQEKEPDDYLDRLREAVRGLPPEYRRVTITGGEPTLSTHLSDAVGILRKEREWDAVVLTTNGIRMDHYIGLEIDHVNLSRHHHEDAENDRIFGGDTLDAVGATVIACLLNRRGIDLTWNCVLCGQFDGVGGVVGFIAFARDCSASAVTFRADQRNGTTGRPRELGWMSGWKVSERWSCEACRTWRQTVHGMPVAWKASVPEPSKLHGHEYELILQADGRLTLDWAGDAERIGDMIRVKRDGAVFECDTAEEALAIIGSKPEEAPQEKPAQRPPLDGLLRGARCGVGGAGDEGRCGR